MNLTSKERSKIKRFLIYLYQNNKYGNKDHRTNRTRLLECIDLVENKSVFEKEESLDIRLFLDSAIVNFKENRFGYIIDDEIFKNAYDKIFNMYLA